MEKMRHKFRSLRFQEGNISSVAKTISFLSSNQQVLSLIITIGKRPTVKYLNKLKIDKLCKKARSVVIIVTNTKVI